MAENLDSEPGQSKKKKSKFGEKVLKIIKKAFGKKSYASFEESVSELIREHNTDDSIHEEEKTILKNIITFGDLEADDVMVTRTDIVAVPSNVKVEELKRIFIKHNHSRIPVYNGSMDNIIGFVHLKDFFRMTSNKGRFSLKEITRDLIYVPATIKITDLLSRMKNSSVHLAIVLDEYGGTDGLVTIEDIVSEVLGEIKDEYNDDEPMDIIQFDKEGCATIDAKVEVTEVNKALKAKIPINSEYDTFGGFIITYLGRIPQKGEKISHPLGLEMEILDADNRKIKMVKVKLEQPVKE